MQPAQRTRHRAKTLGRRRISTSPSGRGGRRANPATQCQPGRIPHLDLPPGSCGHSAHRRDARRASRPPVAPRLGLRLRRRHNHRPYVASFSRNCTRSRCLALLAMNTLAFSYRMSCGPSRAPNKSGSRGARPVETSAGVALWLSKISRSARLPGCGCPQPARLPVVDSCSAPSHHLGFSEATMADHFLQHCTGAVR